MCIRDRSYANELVKDGKVVENVFAGLDNVNSPGSKAVARALPEIKTTLETAFGQHLSDEIANPQIQKILNDVPRLATTMAKNLQAVESSFSGNDEAALRAALGDIVKRIKADNPSQFDEAASLSGYTAANYQHKGNLLGTGGFKVRGSNGIEAYSDENAGPSIGQKILNLLGFKRNVENGISKDPSKDLINDSTNIFPGFTRQDDIGFDLDTHDPHNIIPSRQIQVLSTADPLKRHWTQIYNMQARKIGKEPIDWKTAYPQAYQDSLIHYASSDEEKDLARQGDVASIERLTQLRENNKELPPNYRVSVMGMVVARDQVIPEIHFNKNLIYGAKLESRTYAEFLKNNEDQVKASKWLTHRLLVIADQDTDSAPEMAMRAFVGLQYGEEAMKNFDNKEQIDFARRSWWAYKSGNKSQTDFPGDIRISAVKPQPVSYGFPSLNPITGWRDAGRTLAKMEAQKESVTTEKQNQQILNREKAITSIKESIQSANDPNLRNIPIAMPYARMLLGDDIVEGLIQANAGNYDALQQALRNELEQWMKPI